MNERVEKMNSSVHTFPDWPVQSSMIDKYFSHKKPVEFWDEELVNQYLLEAVKEVLAYVYENNAYYKRIMDGSGVNPGNFNKLRDIERIPCTTKNDLRKNPFLILSVPKEKISQIHLSTGTTGGEVIYMMHTWEDLFVRDIAPELPVVFPIEPGDMVVNALPYEMSSAGLAYHRVIQDGKHATVIPVGKGGFYSDPEKTLKAMKNLDANVMITTPSYSMYLAEFADQMGYKLGTDIRLKHIWITGEGCSDAFRDRIEKIWGCKALFYYGSLECGVLGIECSKKQGYHIISSHIFLEILDRDTGEVLGPGETGEIVVTTLLREGSPLVRYGTEDLGYIEDIPCECGVTLKRLFLRGRKNDQIEIDGKEYSPFYIENCLMSIEEVGNNYRFIVMDDHLLIETEISKEFKSTKSLEESISSRVEYACGIPNQVRFVEKIPYNGGKVVRVINQKTKK